MDSDEQLYARVRAGDLVAFDTLYARYERPLYGFLFASLKNRADAEDAFHETFLNALKGPLTSFDRGGFRAWIFRVGRNVALNRLRKAARGAAAAVGALDAPDAPPIATDVIEERERRLALDSAVERLPSPLAEIYRLRTSGLSYDEIASVLETPLGTVKSRMHEMVRLLREEMRSWTARG